VFSPTGRPEPEYEFSVAIRSSYEGQGPPLDHLGNVVGVALVYPCKDGVEIRPKDCGTWMRPNDLPVAFDGPAGLLATDSDDAVDGHCAW
jgi:hypothetical protein